MWYFNYFSEKLLLRKQTTNQWYNCSCLMNNKPNFLEWMNGPPTLGIKQLPSTYWTTLGTKGRCKESKLWFFPQRAWEDKNRNSVVDVFGLFLDSFATLLNSSINIGCVHTIYQTTILSSRNRAVCQSLKFVGIKYKEGVKLIKKKFKKPNNPLLKKKIK